MKVQVVDPAAYTPAYDHALCRALGRAGAEVELATAPFPYGSVPSAEGYRRVERFYRGLPGGAGSALLRAGRAARHLPDMIAWRRSIKGFDLIHAQWLAVQGLDVHLLPKERPLVMTAHDVLPREPRPGQVRAQARLWQRADAVVVHSEHGRARLVDALGVDGAKVEVIPHGP
ncbi:MAG: glycosyltransferase family 4 protein, partial [Actinomycetes bacterium]